MPRAVSHDRSDSGYVQLLSGPLETLTMRLGRVTLAPGKSVGKHSTEDYEEILVVPQGQGEMHITGGATLQLGKSVMAYCLPQTEHDVVNTGTDLLRYVYVIAKAR